MEPLNATVKVDGDKVETWSGNQSPTTMKILGSIAAGTTPDKVTVHTAYLGGGFGRKTDGDELFQTTLLAKAVSPRASEDDLEPRRRHHERQIPPADRAARGDRS